MKQIVQIIREVVTVIIGILIALAVNNWNEDRKDEKYLNQIYSSIENELEQSNLEIKESIPKQQVLIDSIAKYLSDESISLFDILMKADGINTPLIKNYSWKAIANSKIELIKFEKLTALSEIDESKKGLERKTEKLIDYLNANLLTTNPEKKEVFMLLSQDIIATTKFAQFEIEEFLKK